MKRKIILKAILSFAIVVAIITSIIAFSISWYPGTLEYGHRFSIEADGFLFLYIPAITEDSKQVLLPAVAMPHAVSNGLYMDVLREYDEADEYPSYVEKAAKIISYTTDFRVYSETRYVQMVDEEGNPIFDEDGNPVYEPLLDEDEQIIVDDEGNIRYKKEALPVLMDYNLNIKDSADEDGQYLDMDELTIKEFYFSYNAAPIADGESINEENGAIPYEELNFDKTSGKVILKGNSEVYVHMQIYLSSVDELLPLDFIKNDIYLEIGLSAVTIES